MPDILNTTEAAEYLRVSIPTLRGLASSGAIPAAKIGDDWRFVRQHLLSYVVNLAEAGQRNRQENPRRLLVIKAEVGREKNLLTSQNTKTNDEKLKNMNRT